MLVVKNLPANSGDIRTAEGLIPGSGRSPGVGNGNPLQYSCLDHHMDRGDWQTIVQGLKRVRPDWSDLAPTQSIWDFLIKVSFYDCCDACILNDVNRIFFFTFWVIIGAIWLSIKYHSLFVTGIHWPILSLDLGEKTWIWLQYGWTQGNDLVKILLKIFCASLF